jgi:hypothetical protein
MFHTGNKDYNELIELAKKYISIEAEINEYVAIYYIGTYFRNSDNRKYNCIIMRSRCQSNDEIAIALPFIRKILPKRLRVGKPELMNKENIEESNIQDIYSSFFKGVDKNDKGKMIWEKAYSEI